MRGGRTMVLTKEEQKGLVIHYENLPALGEGTAPPPLPCLYH